MKYGKTQTVAPLIEPLMLAAVKSRLRVTQTDDDTEFTSVWIPAARHLVEKYTGRQLITQTWKITYDAFPYGVGQRYSVGNDAPSGFNDRGASVGNVVAYDIGFDVPLRPLQSVTSIQYYDGTNALQTLDPANYEVDTHTNPARIMPVFNSVWPTTYPRTSAVTITVVVGFGDTASTVPADLLAAMLLQIKDWYETDAVVSTESGLSMVVRSLLNLNWSGALE